MISCPVSRLDFRRDMPRWLPRGLAAAVLGAALGLGLPATAPAQPQAATPQVMLPDFSELAERVGPSVVNIRTLERGRQAARGQGEMDPNMEEFFRRFGIPLPGRPTPRPVRLPLSSSGSSRPSSRPCRGSPMPTSNSTSCSHNTRSDSPLYAVTPGTRKTNAVINSPSPLRLS